MGGIEKAFRRRLWVTQAPGKEASRPKRRRRGRRLSSCWCRRHSKSPSKTPTPEETNTIGERCTKDDIRVYQGATTRLPNGIPTYTVEILNVCVSGCAISGIHLSCGGSALRA